MFGLLPIGLFASTANQEPVAEFSSVRTFMSVDFTDESTDVDGEIVSWDWDWGDGTAHGTTQNPTHVYTTEGSKTVRLTVTDDDDATHFVEHDVTPTRGVPVPAAMTNGRGSDNTSGMTATTGSISPTANVPVYMAVANLQPTGTIASPTSVVGCNLTWTPIGTAVQISSFRRLQWYMGIGAAPSAGTVVITYANNQDMILWDAYSVSQAIAAGTPAQSKAGEFGVSTSGTVTFNSALEHANNINLTAIITRNASGTSTTPDAQFTELGEQVATNGANSTNLEVQWARNEVACTGGWVSNSAAMSSLEVKAV